MSRLLDIRHIKWSCQNCKAIFYEPLWSPRCGNHCSECFTFKVTSPQLSSTEHFELMAAIETINCDFFKQTVGVCVSRPDDDIAFFEDRENLRDLLDDALSLVQWFNKSPETLQACHRACEGEDTVVRYFAMEYFSDCYRNLQSPEEAEIDFAIAVDEHEREMSHMIELDQASA